MVGLMDCNNFFVSCERLFRPDLRGKPVAVLSSNDGCIVARSNEVKALGIPMGVPLFEVKDIVEKHQITLFSSNFALYRDISSRVMHALMEEFNDVSIYSIDEAFFEVAEDTSDKDFESIRLRIIQKTGIPVSIGIAPTKTMAKLANGMAKKGNGYKRLTLTEATKLYPGIPVGEVWGIGRQISLRLGTLGVHTVDALIDRGLTFVRKEFGVHGERLFHELSGRRAEGKEEEVSPHASIMSTRSFGRAIKDRALLLGALGYHITHVGEKLRERGLQATGMTIVCAPGRYGNYALRHGARSVVLELPTNDTVELLKVAATLFESLFDPEVPYKKAGVVVHGLIPETFSSRSLFDTDHAQKDQKRVYDIVDSINARFGTDTVRPGLVQGAHEWTPHASLKSRSYTTKWTEIASVKAV